MYTCTMYMYNVCTHVHGYWTTCIYPFNRVQMINQYYDYSVSVTVFTSILKFCKLLRFSASDDF